MGQYARQSLQNKSKKHFRCVCACIWHFSVPSRIIFGGVGRKIRIIYNPLLLWFAKENSSSYRKKNTLIITKLGRNVHPLEAYNHFSSPGIPWFIIYCLHHTVAKTVINLPALGRIPQTSSGGKSASSSRQRGFISFLCSFSFSEFSKSLTKAHNPNKVTLFNHYTGKRSGGTWWRDYNLILNKITLIEFSPWALVFMRNLKFIGKQLYLFDSLSQSKRVGLDNLELQIKYITHNW